MEAGEGTSFATRDKNRNKKRHVTELDDFDKAVVRRTAHNVYIHEKKSPTLSALRMMLIDSINFKGSRSSLHKILKELGFKWQRTKSNRCVLIEKHDIRQKQISYLKQIKKYRNDNRHIVYLDESYILSSHVQNKSWSDHSNNGMLKHVS